ncbi:MAG: hypothetical protein HYX76_01880 [Acidobacteria bacterium]|nr:hypothetical protein [Acidobacteriota bacterium]
MIEISEIRKQLLHTIDRVRREAAERRRRADRAEEQYAQFLTDVAVPVFRMFASALKPEGYAFEVTTPQGKVRLVSTRAADDFIELELDTVRPEPAVVGRAAYRLGKRLVTLDQVVGTGGTPGAITDRDVVAFLLLAIEPFVEK